MCAVEAHQKAATVSVWQRVEGGARTEGAQGHDYHAWPCGYSVLYDRQQQQKEEKVTRPEHNSVRSMKTKIEQKCGPTSANVLGALDVLFAAADGVAGKHRGPAPGAFFDAVLPQLPDAFKAKEIRGQALPDCRERKRPPCNHLH